MLKRWCAALLCVAGSAQAVDWDPVQTYSMLPMAPDAAVESGWTVNGLWCGFGMPDAVRNYIFVEGPTDTYPLRFTYTTIKEYVDACHRAGTLAPATLMGVAGHPGLRHRFPEMELASCVGADGKRAFWDPGPGNSYFMCVNNPIYGEVLLARGNEAIDAGADLIVIDEIQGNEFCFYWSNEPGFCKHCIAAYRSHLRESYSPEQLKERFGFDDLESFDFATSLTGQRARGWKDTLPLFRELWHLQERLTFDARKRLVDGLRAHMAQTGRTIPVCGNTPGAGLGDFSGFRLSGLKWGQILDFIAMENHRGEPLPQGKWVANERMAAAIYGLPSAITTTYEPLAAIQKDFLEGKGNRSVYFYYLTAEAYANGCAFINYHQESGFPQARGLWEDTFRAQRFVRDHRDLYTDRSDRGARVALLFIENEGQRFRTYSFMGACQALAESNIPFDVVTDGDAKFIPASLTADKLRPYSLVCLTQGLELQPQQRKALDTYVQAGGTLLVADSVEFGLAAGEAESKRGEGMVCALPQVEVDGRGACDLAMAYFLAYKDEQRHQLADIVNAHAEPMLEVRNAGREVTVYPFLQRESKRIALHVLNADYDAAADRMRPKENITIRVRRPDFLTSETTAHLLSPELDAQAQGQSVPVRADGEFLEVNLARLDVYTVVVLGGPESRVQPAATAKPEARTYLMGFQDFMWDNTDEARAATYDFLNKNADIVCLQFGDVPWPEAYDDAPYPEDVMQSWRQRNEGVAPGVKRYVEIGPLNMTRSGMGGNLTEAFKGKAFNDPAIKKAYLNYARRVRDYFKPDYFCIGIELNEIMDNAPDQWPDLLELYTETRDALKKDNPNLPIFASVTLHRILNARQENDQERLDRLKSFLAQCDIAAISFYQFMGNFGGVERTPEYFAWLREFVGDKPMAISETNYPAEPIAIKNLSFAGSPELQWAYLDALLEAAQRDRYVFVIWFSHRDYDAWWEKVKGQYDEWVKLWKDTGLLDGNGAPRAAFDLWTRKFTSARPSAPVNATPIGLGIPDPDKPDEWSTAADIGLSFYCTIFGWNEPTPDAYEWPASADDDALLRHLRRLKEQGFKVGFTNTTIHMDQKHMPPYLEGRRLIDPVVLDRWQLFLKAFLARYGECLDFLNLGNEVDSYFGAHADEWPDYLEFLKCGAETVRAVSPNIRIGAVLSSGGVSRYWPDIASSCDHLAVTYYTPCSTFDKSPTAQALDPAHSQYFARQLETCLQTAAPKPILITEVGCATSPTIDSSPEIQAQFIHALFAWLPNHADRILGMSWLSIIDWPRAHTRQALKGFLDEKLLQHEAFMDYLTSLGLMREDGAKKPGWEAFRREVRRYRGLDSAVKENAS